MQNLKGKVKVNSLDLSAYLVSSLVHSLGVAVAVDVDSKAALAEGPENILNTELIITEKGNNPGQTQIYGDLAICDFIISQHNFSTGQNVHRLGENLAVDNYLHKLSGAMKNACNRFAIVKD